MSPGDRVVFPADPLLYGVGVIEEVVCKGDRVLLAAKFEAGEHGYVTELFDPHELELLSKYVPDEEMAA